MRKAITAIVSIAIFLVALPLSGALASEQATFQNLTIFEAQEAHVRSSFIDATGNKTTNLTFFGRADVDGRTFSSGNNYLSLIFRTDTQGKISWIREVPGVADMVVGRNGSIAITTFTHGSSNQGALSSGCSNPCGHLEVWSDKGEFLWTKKFPRNVVAQPRVDDTGNVYAVISVSSSRILGEAQSMFAPYTFEATAAQYAWVVAKFTPDGAISWAKQIPAGSFFVDYATSQEGEVYISGTYSAPITLPKTGAVAPSGKFANGYFLVLGKDGLANVSGTFADNNEPIQSAEIEAFPDGTFGLVTKATQLRTSTGQTKVPYTCVSFANSLWKISPKAGAIQWCSSELTAPITASESGTIFATVHNDLNTTIVALNLAGEKKWNLTIATDAIQAFSLQASTSGELTIAGALRSTGINGSKPSGLPLGLGSGLILKSSSTSEGTQGGGQDGLTIGVKLPVTDFLKSVSKKAQIALAKGVVGSAQLSQARNLLSGFQQISVVTCEAPSVVLAKAICKPFAESSLVTKTIAKASQVAKSKKTALITVSGLAK